MAALRGEPVDKTPLSVYEYKMKQSSMERMLRNRGLCIIQRTATFNIVQPNVGYRSFYEKNENGNYVTTHIYSTPHGDLRQVTQDAGFTAWKHEHLFKTPDDYKALRFLIHDSIVTPAYEAAEKMVDELGEDFIVRGSLCLEPMQSLISNYMGTETFCFEWMDNRDEIMLLYDELREVARKIYPIVAAGPLDFINYGGNVTPSVIGREVFQKYYCPNYAEAAEALHKTGKTIGTHLDADNTIIMEDVAGTPLDYIEAFDPGMGPSLSQACEKWPDKALWINFPSAWHLHDAEQIYKETAKLIQDGKSAKGFVISVTEDPPPERWPGNLKIIMDAIDDCAK